MSLLNLLERFVNAIILAVASSKEKKVLSIAQQTNQVLRNLAVALEASDSDIAYVLKTTTVYISEIPLLESGQLSLYQRGQSKLIYYIY